MILGGVTHEQACQIVGILECSPEMYSSDNVIAMLKKSETIVTDDDGRMCILYVNDADRLLKREMWMIFATPVAMALYLRRFTLAKQLLENGYSFEPLKHFLAFNIEGELSRRAGCSEYNGQELLSGDYDMCKFNDFSNLELMTCMISTPKWIVDGVWEELLYMDEDAVVFDTVIDNMELYYNYSDLFVRGYCRMVNRKKRDYGRGTCSTEVSSSRIIENGGRNDILECYIGCLKRLNCQLTRLSGGDYPKLDIRLSGRDFVKDNFDSV